MWIGRGEEMPWLATAQLTCSVHVPVLGWRPYEEVLRITLCYEPMVGVSNGDQGEVLAVQQVGHTDGGRFGVFRNENLLLFYQSEGATLLTAFALTPKGAFSGMAVEGQKKAFADFLHSFQDEAKTWRHFRRISRCRWSCWSPCDNRMREWGGGIGHWRDQRSQVSSIVRWATEELVAQATAAPLAVFVVLVALALLLLRPDSAAVKQKDKQVDHEDSAINRFMDRLGVPADVHLEGCCLPGSSLVINQKITEKYFMGKKRLWETRVQMKFKKPPLQADVFFGVETEQYVPMSRAVKSTMDGVVRMLKSAVGNQIYHSIGDNPEDYRGSARELELPTFVMPMLAFDQFIVTPAGEEPPELDDECIPELGSKRVNRVREFQKDLDNLVFEVGATYTFCFWGISQWLDKLNWQDCRGCWRGAVGGGDKLSELKLEVKQTNRG
eukprot:g7205.t1